MQQNTSVWLIDNDEDVINLFRQALSKQMLTCQVKSFKDAATLLTEIKKNHQSPSVIN